MRVSLSIGSSLLIRTLRSSPTNSSGWVLSPLALRRRRLEMHDVLFDADTSTRRALILALGTFTAEDVSRGERETTTSKLLDLYRNDPDSGIHGAAQWALRQWKKQDEDQGRRRRAEAARGTRTAALVCQ